MNEDKLYLTIGDNLRTCREKHIPAYSQAQLAEIVGLDRSSVSNIEKGHQRVSIHTLYILCEALDVKPQDVLPKLQEVEDASKLPPQATEALNKIIRG